MKQRQGVTLLEIVVVLGLVTAFSTLVFDLYRDGQVLVESCARYQLGTREAQDLARRLRRDVRGSLRATAGPSTLTLSLPEGRRVVYRLDDTRVVREVFAGDAQVEGLLVVHGVESLDFSAGPGPGLVTWALRLRRVSPQGRIDPVFDGVAAVRGVTE